MKPQNFPARKAARRMAARIGGSSRELTHHPDVLNARDIRTKKYRGSL